MSMPSGNICDRCPNGEGHAVGFIPIGENNRINVCKRHMEEARRLCYYVLRNDQNENAGSSDFDHRTWKKHIQLRGSREFKFEPRRYQRIAKEEEAVA